MTKHDGVCTGGSTGGLVQIDMEAMEMQTVNIGDSGWRVIREGKVCHGCVNHFKVQ